jgi:hypothetical protein
MEKISGEYIALKMIDAVNIAPVIVLMIRFFNIPELI